MRKILLAALLPVCLFSCKKTTVQPAAVATNCDPATSYAVTVRPVFISNCTAGGCHDGTDLPSLADYNVAHDAAAQIRIAVATGVMPRNGSLPAAGKAAIICWIDNGAKNN